MAIRRTIRFIRGITATQWAVGFFAAYLFLWVIAVTVLLSSITARYFLVTVSQDRVEYSVSGAAAWAKAEAARVLMGAHHARIALRAALRTGVLTGPWDVAGLERALAPVFAASPQVRTMDLYFRLHKVVLEIGHTDEGEGALRVSMRSNSPGCHLLGLESCMPHMPQTKGMPTWAHDVWELPSTASTGDEEIDEDRFGRDATAWATSPRLILERGQAATWMDRTWFLSYPLLFRLAEGNLTNSTATVYGRVAVELADLSLERLQDEQLGPDGAIYLCDREGYVLASADPQDLVRVDGRSGAVQPTLLMALSASDGWWPKVRDVLYSGEDADLYSDAGSYVAVSFLKAPLQRFALVLVVPSPKPFQHGGTEAIALAGSVCVGLSYAGTLAATAWVMRKSVARAAGQRSAAAHARLQRMFPGVFKPVAAQADDAQQRRSRRPSVLLAEKLSRSPWYVKLSRSPWFVKASAMVDRLPKLPKLPKRPGRSDVAPVPRPGDDSSQDEGLADAGSTSPSLAAIGSPANACSIEANPDWPSAATGKGADNLRGNRVVALPGTLS